jgi:antitoxin YefM
MEVLNYSELRKNLAAHLESVANEHELLIVSRGEGKNVVLLSLEDYNALKETAHLLGSAGNAIRLKESLQEAKGGTFERHNLQD